MANNVPPQTAPPQPASQGPQPDSARAPGEAGPGNAALKGLLEPSGDFLIDIAGGLRFPAASIAGEGKEIPVKLGELGRAVPGLTLREAVYRPGSSSKRLTVKGAVAVPHVEAKDFQFHVSKDGRPRFRLKGLKTTLPAVGSPKIDVSLGADRELAASIKVAPKDLTPKGLGKSQLKVEGEGTFNLAGGKFSGELGATLAYPRLGSGRIDLAFLATGRLSGSGHVELSAPFAKGVRAELEVDEAGSVNGEIRVGAAELVPPVAGLKLTAGEVFLRYEDGMPSGGLEAVAFSYPGFGEAVVTASIEKAAFSGKGDFKVTVSQLAEVTGNWSFVRGVLIGSVKVSAKDFPDALPIESGAITATLGDSGAVAFKGEVRVTLGPAGSGQLRAEYSEKGEVMIGATIDLTVPGLQGASVTVDYVNGALEGEADIPIDVAVLPGIGGAVHVKYREGRWSGETELSYEADNGKLKGTIRVNVAQTEQGALQVGGGGEVTAQLMPSLQGTLTATILPEGGVDVSGSIVVTDPIPLFDEKKFDKELFKYSQNIPLWAILVAVIRLRAGVRAGIGPGVFRNIKVEGSYTIGQEGEPSFSISGEMFIPAYVEGYVAFGAGLGLDVVLGSLTGGIEAVATAGIYGAISVIPELSYENGDYRIEGTATMAAGARLKVGLNAWAEVEALWITVWENEWKLAEWVWNVGPDLALQAKMAYTFGKPEPPALDFSTSDIDSEKLIKDAMPKDGPAPSGAKEALKNKAEWKGALKKPKPPPPVPAELSQQATQKEKPPAPKKKPPKKAGPRTDDPTQPNQPGKTDRTGAKKQAEDAAAKPAGSEETKPQKDVPTAKQKRYPKPVTLKTLDEPPAPMPRTKQQQKEDEQAAVKVVVQASKAAGSTDTLDNYFPRIKKRFALSSVRFVGDLDKGLMVRTEANPYTDTPIHEPVQSLGAGFVGKEASEVTFSTVNLSQTVNGKAISQTVGVAMDATKLGPTHGKGSETRTSNLGSVMSVLPQKKGEGDRKFVRGHLLNADLGGPGSNKNLFPITAQANADHLNRIEADVKKLVNDDLYWVHYRVKIEDQSEILTDAAGVNYINSDLVAEARILNTDGTSSPARKVTIRSSYRPSDKVSDEDKAAFKKTIEPKVEGTLAPGATPKQEDVATFDKSKIETTKDDERKLGEGLFGAYGALYGLLNKAPGVDWAYLRKRVVTGAAGLGEAAFDAGTRAYQLAGGNPDADVGAGFPDKQKKVDFGRVKERAGAIKTVADQVGWELEPLRAFLAALPSPPEASKWSALVAAHANAPRFAVELAADAIEDALKKVGDGKSAIRARFREVGGASSDAPLLRMLRTRIGVRFKE